METDAFDISLGHYRGPLDTVLLGLQRAQLEAAILELEGATPDELFELVEARTATQPDINKANHIARHGLFRLGPIRFGGGPLQLPLEHDNLAQLRKILRRHADPEIAIHLRVRDADGYLVEAPDVGDNEIWVSKRLGAETLERLRATLGDNLSPSKD